MPKPKVMPQSSDEEFIQPGTKGEKLLIETFHCLRFGYCDKDAQSDFIDNIQGEFNIYVADSFDEDGDHHLLIYTNNQLQVIKNGILENYLDQITENTIDHLNKNKAKALIISSYENNSKALLGIKDYDANSYFEADEGEDVMSYKPCFFGLSSATNQIENCILDSHAGTILFMGNEIPNLSQLYGYLDEDEWGTIIGLKE